jgi:hypothetical protein
MNANTLILLGMLTMSMGLSVVPQPGLDHALPPSLPLSLPPYFLRLLPLTTASKEQRGRMVDN